MSDVDFAGTQRLALVGFNTDHCAHVILEIVDIHATRQWLREALECDCITHGAPDPLTVDRQVRGQQIAVNIGITHRGLLALGLDGNLLKLLEDLAPAFVEGAAARAARRLGDTLDSAAENWDPRFAAASAHVLLSVHGNDPDTIAGAMLQLAALPGGRDGMRGWGVPMLGRQINGGGAPQRPIRLSHFGFRDGIARPVIIPREDDRHQSLVAKGELLLGYPNAADFDRWSEVRPASAAGFLRNGSFAAFRMIQQHERVFRKWLKDTVADLKKAGQVVTEEYLMAKMCGRWPNGAVVCPDDTQSPTQVPPDDQIDVFDFVNDPTGVGCPFGSHVRRTNPRSDHDVHDRLRPLFRRGMPYGPVFTPETADADRGLLGLFFCASLEDQFEHLMSQWIDKVPLGPDNRGNAKDPLAGMHDDAKASFEIPQRSGPSIMVRGFKPFMRTRGTLYAFYPSLHALQVIAGGIRAAVAPPAMPPKPLPLSPVFSPPAPARAAGAARSVDPRTEPPPVPPGDLTADTALPDRYCDIIMEGGITSGVLYPAAAVELAKVYRFKSIGGSSVGAFAAAVTAAAEYRRRYGYVDGLNLLRKVPDQLAKKIEGEAQLFWMFRPQEKTRRLFNLFVATLNRRTWTRRLVAGVKAALQQYWWLALLGVLVVAVLFGSGFLTHALLGQEAVGRTGWLEVLGFVALGGSIVAFLALTAVAAMAAVFGGVLWDLATGLVPNGFGLCHGGPAPYDGKDASRESDDAPPLTVSLHRFIQACAGRDSLSDAPLTFKDLWDAPGYPPAWVPAEGRNHSIELQVYATNLAHGRPYRFPLDGDDEMARLFFDPDELKPLFPEHVINHMVGHAKPYRPATPADPPVTRVGEGIYELPREELPIVVAARISLSFPGLISAVPLWAIDYSAKSADDRRLRRCWFSDGGLCSNFPIHLFDSFVPRWPTFGITLQTRQEMWEHERVWLPTRHWQGGGDMRDDSDRDRNGEEVTSGFRLLGSFLSRLWNATWRWNDMTLMRMPGVRDRVVRVFLKPGEGGLNIRMGHEEILKLASTYGEPAAHAFIRRFRDDRGWQEHRWVRLNSLLAAARARVAGVSESLGQTHHAMPLRAQVTDALRESPLEGRREKALKSTQAAELLQLIDALERLEKTFSTAGNTSPFIPKPRPSLRVRQPN